MSEFGVFGDVHVMLADDYVATVEIRRPPNNFFDRALLARIVEAFDELSKDEHCRAIVLCSKGRHFCAGVDMSSPPPSKDEEPGHLYDEAVRLFANPTPVVAAIQGAAVGGGLGLALMADFRVASPEARFSANFARLGFHHGFGLTVTLPRLVGQQRAAEMLYTGQRVKSDEALRIGLCDRLATTDSVRNLSRSLASEIAQSAPLAVRSIRDTLRGDLCAEIRAATDHEKAEQERLQRTSDFREGVRATIERRPPEFLGR
jgi:enoyl-CoA hydratase/carnithine racemase